MAFQARLLSVTAALALVTAATAAAAQTAGTPAPAAVAGLPEGVAVVPPPPAGYDPLTASPAQNAKYGIPPAPDATVSPDAFNRWRAAVAGQPLYAKPVLSRTTISNQPVKLVGQPTVSNAATTGTSNNWSGSAIYGIKNPVNAEAIESTFVVPTAHQAFGACTGGWDYSSIWPGIDGYGSSDVLQGGVEADAYCNGSSTSSYYSAWVEWYPYNETRVSVPAISPGDVLFVEVWNTSTTTGYVYFHNYSTNVTQSYSLTAPSGTTLSGTSVEWIAERPGVSGGLATLTNYIASTLTSGLAWDYTVARPYNYYPNHNPGVGTLYYLTMLDNNGAGISSGTGFNASTLYFQDFGSACGLSASPPC